MKSSIGLFSVRLRRKQYRKKNKGVYKRQQKVSTLFKRTVVNSVTKVCFIEQGVYIKRRKKKLSKVRVVVILAIIHTDSLRFTVIYNYNS